MSEIPSDLKYTREHEWVRLEADGTAVLGITDHAQQQLGELVYVELPEPGHVCKPGDALAVVESTKAASDVYAPFAGTVVGSNPALASEPELVNSAPYADGWLVRIRADAPGALGDLMDAGAYRELLEAEA